MDQITDSLAPRAGANAKVAGRPARQADGAAADTIADPAAARFAGPEGEAPAQGRKPSGSAFSDVMQADPAMGPASSPEAAPPRAGPSGSPQATSPDALATALRPTGQPLHQAVAAPRAPEGGAAPVTGQGADASGRMSTPASPEISRPQTAPAAHDARSRPETTLSATQSGAPARDRPDTPRGTEGANAAQRPIPVPIQRVLPAVSGGVASMLEQARLVPDGAQTKPIEVNAAARDFAQQMTRGAARLAPDAPTQTMLAGGATSTAAARVAEGVGPGVDLLADAGPDGQSTPLGGERQGLLLTPGRVAPNAAAALPQFQAGAQPATAPDSILAQISTHSSANGRSEMTLQLDPPELGLVRIGLTMGEGHVTAVITAERADIDGMLRRHAAQLSAALEDAGYHGVDLSFGDGGQGTADDRPDARAGEASFVRLSATEPPLRPSPGGSLMPGDGLDLRL